VVGEVFQDAQELGALEEGEVAGAEVVEHGTEGFGPDRSAIVQAPG
jgi:hypothetical protein